MTRRIDQVLTRLAVEDQIALILQLEWDFEQSGYPALLDVLAAAQQGDDAGCDDVPRPKLKQTVSVRTISVPGVSGKVLEFEGDLDDYLAKYRAALVATLNDGKRITL